MKELLVTGSAGFIAGYLIEELLEAGHAVVGLDNFSKYGRVSKSYDEPPALPLRVGDAKDVALMREVCSPTATTSSPAPRSSAGSSYFHEQAYDLIAENERITAAAFDAAIWAAQGEEAREDHRPFERRWSSRTRRCSRPPRASSCSARRRQHVRLPEAGAASTSRRARTSSTGCRTRSSGRSTASASARSGRSAARRSSAATSSWR